MFSFEVAIGIGFGFLVLVIIYSLFNKWLVLHYNELNYKALNTVISLVYDTLYKHQILASKINGAGLSRRELDDLRKVFLDTVYSTLGKAYVKRLIKLHGSKDALDMYILLQFDHLVDSDLVQTSR